MLIEPFVKVGNLSFSDNRTQIRETLNEKFESSVKEFNQIKEYCDYFPNIGLFVYYDNNDNVNAFEFFGSNLEFKKYNLLNISYKDLLNLFKKIDPNLETEYNGFTSMRYGIGGGTNDDPEDENSMPESIIVFKKGYYDQLNS